MKQEATVEIGLERFSVTLEMHDDYNGTFSLNEINPFTQALIDYSHQGLFLRNPVTGRNAHIYITQTRIDRSTGQVIGLIDFSIFT